MLALLGLLPTFRRDSIRETRFLNHLRLFLRRVTPLQHNILVLVFFLNFAVLLLRVRHLLLLLNFNGILGFLFAAVLRRLLQLLLILNLIWIQKLVCLFFLVRVVFTDLKDVLRF